MALQFELQFAEKLSQLKSLTFQFDEPSTNKKIVLLKTLPLSVSLKPKTVLQFHQVLLCICVRSLLVYFY